MNRIVRVMWVMALLVVHSVGQQHVLQGRVRDAERVGVVGARVFVRWRVAPELPGLVGWTLPAEAGLDAGLTGVARRIAETDETGRWRLEVPVAGPFEVVAATADGEQRSVRTFPVLVGTFVEQVLEPTFYVAGVLRDIDGNAMPQAPLRFDPHTQTWARLALQGMPRTHAVVMTDDAGRFEYALDSAYLREPRWEPYIEPRPGNPAFRFARTPLLQPLESCRELDLQVAAAVLQSGVVRDRAGNGIAGARVFSWLEPWRSVRADAHGRFEIHVQMVANLAATAPGFSLTKLPAKKRAAGTPCVFEMVPASKVRVRLLDGNGAPLIGRAVLWSWSDVWEAPLERLSKTDGEGFAVFDDAPATGNLTGFVKVDGVYCRFARLVAPADVELGDRTVLVRRVAGMVTNADGEPMPAARVVAVAAGDKNRLSTMACTWVTYTDHGGRYRFPALPSDPLRILCEASHEGFASKDLAADVDRCDLKTRADGLVSMQVVDAESRPIASAWVTLTAAGGLDAGIAPSASHQQATVVGFTDEKGQLRFRSLPDAKWIVLGHALREHVLWFGMCEAHTGDVGIEVELREFGR